MYAAEESDSGIVPMNHSNKAEQSVAESEEERPPIEENTLQPQTRQVQSGVSVSQGLAGVRKAGTYGPLTASPPLIRPQPRRVHVRITLFAPVTILRRDCSRNKTCSR